MVMVIEVLSDKEDSNEELIEIRKGRLRIRYVMPSTQLALREEDVVRLALEFLHNRELHITQLSLERETGIINGNFADDVLFLRQLILDGQWDDVLEFIQPLGALKLFQLDKFNYIIMKHKYIELLCIKSEIKAYNNVDNIVEEVVKVLSDLEKYAPSKEEYSNMCLLLTLPSITDHAQFKKWNPSNARVQCFREVYPLVEEFLPCEKKPSGAATAKCAKNDRLMQLLIKGILYESCVNYCQFKASGTKEAQSADISFSKLLDGSSFDESDLSLLSWLHSIPAETFSVPFEQRTLNVDVERLERPSLHTSWTEHMMVTPIKPRTFPHLAMPFRRPRSAAESMTRSLRPLPDGAPRHPAIMAISALDLGTNVYSSCFAGFHLTASKNNRLMTTSVDRLFEKDPDGRIVETPVRTAPKVDQKTPNSPERSGTCESSPEHRGRESPVSASTARSSRRDSLTNPLPPSSSVANAPQQSDFSRELLKEYQLQKQKECDVYMRQLCSGEAQNAMENQPEAVVAMQPSTLNGGGERQNQTNTHPSERNAASHQPNQRGDVVEVAKSNEQSSLNRNATSHQAAGNGRPTFRAVTVLEDLQAVRCAEFHPDGKLYAVGSNTKTLRICGYPNIDDISESQEPFAPSVLFKRTKHHKGSIYCLAWSTAGDLLATGSNDKTVKLMRFNSDTSNLEGQEVELAMHDGTVRDVCFIEDSSNKNGLLLSGGAGDCKIYVTDCATGKPFQSFTGHSGHVLSLFNWGGAMFVSGSQDKTIRFWDLRAANCVNVLTPAATAGNRLGSAVTSIAVEPSGRLLVSGHEDASCALYDVRGSRTLQRFTPHSADVRSVRFSPGAYYLLTASYDGKIMLTDLQGDLTMQLPSVVVAKHNDKVISGRWHPEDFSFISTSADKTATLWTIPPA